MKKFVYALATAAALSAATLGVATPASAAPYATGCSVHTTYQGNPVDVEWC
jgi:hypothetical protein